MEYQLNLVTTEQVIDEIKTVVLELKSNEALRQQATAARIDLQELDRLLEQTAPDKLITIQPKTIGLDPATVAIIVAFSPVAAKITRDLWDNLILPRIRRNHGPNAIKPLSGEKL